MPDLDFKSNASFISSKEGGMPVSRTRSWMNISNSYCLRVSMRFFPHDRALYLGGEQSRYIHESFYFSSASPSTRRHIGTPVRNGTLRSAVNIMGGAHLHFFARRPS